MKDKKPEPTCNRRNCFANKFSMKQGKDVCTILTDTDFKQRGGGCEVCPFFKTREEFDKRK